MSMMPVCELWVPDPEGTVLHRTAGSYVGYEIFERASDNVVFARGEGLPGRVWSTQQPEVLSTLDAPRNFVRARAAIDADLSAGFGLPIVHGDQVAAVLAFLVAQGPEPTGVMEVWCPDAKGELLVWHSGFYGQLDEILEVSMATRFAPGQGLPGRVWEHRRPEIVESLWPSESDEFLREEVAMVAGLTTGFAIPVIVGGEVRSVVVLLSTSDMTFAKVIEIWRPNADGTALEKDSGYYGRLSDFGSRSEAVTFGRGEGLPGQVWESGMPQLIAPLDANSGFARYQAAQSVDLTVAMGIPIIDGDEVTSVILMLN